LEIARQAFLPMTNESEPAAESRLRREAVEDILWTLLNSKEFLYVH
jgi:hypothetical protein